MARPRAHTTAAAVDAEIRRLIQERERLIVEEDRQRGALVRAALDGPQGEALRTALTRAIESRDAHLFGLDATRARTDNGGAVRSRTDRTTMAQPMVAAAQQSA